MSVFLRTPAARFTSLRGRSDGNMRPRRPIGPSNLFRKIEFIFLNGILIVRPSYRLILSLGAPIIKQERIVVATRQTLQVKGHPSAEGRIGFVGLGHMGMAMASNLASDGVQVIAYVRRPEQMGKLAALGLEPTTTMADLFNCQIVISMLPDDNAVREIVFGREADGLDGLVKGLQPGTIHLSMSTISTAAASQLASEHENSGQGYVAAPVFGNPDAAKARQLFIVTAGGPADVERCRPLLDSLGQRTFVIGADPAQANLIKLLGNMMTATTLEMLGEAVAVVRKRGLDPKPFLDILTSTMFGGRAHTIYGDKIVRQAYAPGFLMPLAFKDVRLALAEAERAGAPMPSVGVVHDRMIAGIARGYGDLDWSALGLIAADEAGLGVAPPVAIK
jgi:3-hydroxyisobutyrate dehydrogenase-like beta-hydroxyacid dehydrogenase